jgi:hypothetical protein
MSFALAVAFKGVFLAIVLCILAAIRIAIYRWMPNSKIKSLLLRDLRGKSKRT